MNGGRWLLCGGMLALLLSVGCHTLDSFSLAYFSSTATGRERLIAGSLDQVARSLQVSLSDRGMRTEIVQEENALRLRTRSPQGERFALVLTQTVPGQTQVRIEWEGMPDDGLGSALLAEVDLLFTK